MYGLGAISPRKTPIFAMAAVEYAPQNQGNLVIVFAFARWHSCCKCM